MYKKICTTMIKKFSTIGYMGSKAKLCDLIFEEIEKRAPDAKTFADLFAGSGIVTFNALERGYSCVSNDLERYSYAILRGLKTPFGDKLKMIIDELNGLPGVVGNITRNYSPVGGRKYFTEENAMLIDAMMAKIDEIKREVTENEWYFVLSSFVISVDRIKNVSVSFSGFLKEFKSTASKRLVVKPIHERTTEVAIDARNEDASGLGVSVDVAYIDPPYSMSQYGGGFFMLNQIIEFDPDIRGKSGICEYNKSSFCRRRKIEESFRRLMANVTAKLYVVSYNNESLISKDDMVRLLKEFGSVDVIERQHKRFKCNFMNPDAPPHTIEYLFFVVRLI
jgi:adenine-specific DNA-methyltransferase